MPLYVICRDLLIMFHHATTTTSFTVLTSQGPSDHARCTKILVIEFPQAQKFINNCLLLRAASKLRYVAGVFDHAVYVEVCTKSIAESEKYIKNRMR